MTSLIITSLRKRADFLALRRAPSTPSAAFRLVRALRDPGSAPPGSAPSGFVPRGLAPRGLAPPVTRVGFTVTKKIGNAVRRNRVRRRLKFAVAAVFPLQAEVNADYVVIARAAAFDRPFADLLADMEKALLILKRTGKARNR